MPQNCSYNYKMTPLIMIVIVAVGLVIIALLVRIDRGPARSGAISQDHFIEKDPASIWPATAPAASDPGANLPLEQKLANLARCGIKLAEPFTVEDLVELDSREALDKDGYWALLGLLGGTEQKEPWRQMCDSFYVFDIKCIENASSYTEVLECLAAITKGDMVLSDIHENVATGTGGPSSISFLCNGRKISISFEQDWKYFSEHVLDYVLKLLSTTSSKRQYFFADLEDQCVFIGCLLPEQIEQLRQLGLSVTVFKDRFYSDGKVSLSVEHAAEPARPAPAAVTPGTVPVSTSASAGEKLTLEQKLTNLAQCGLKLAEPFTVEDLLTSWPRKRFEEPGYDFLISTLGYTEEREPWRQRCASYFTFDSECIENEDDYTKFLLQIAAMTRGDMVLSDFSEQVPIGGGKASLKFSCNGQPVAIEFQQNNDWFNEQVLDQVLMLLQTTDSKRVFFMRDAGDQTVEIGCLFPEQIEQLNALGLAFELY